MLMKLTPEMKEKIGYEFSTCIAKMLLTFQDFKREKKYVSFMKRNEFAAHLSFIGRKLNRVTTIS